MHRCRDPFRVFVCSNKSRGLVKSAELPRVGCFGQSVAKEQ